MKTSWNIIKSETGKRVGKGDEHLLNINGNLTDNQQMIANTFNHHFLTSADKIIDNNRKDKIRQQNNINPKNYVFKIFKHPFPNINLIVCQLMRLKKK